MSTATEIFEIEPFRHEFEGEARFAGGARSRPRAPTAASKPWPSFRKRRILRTPGSDGGWRRYPPATDPEPQAEPEPSSAAPAEYVRWLQSTLNRAIGGALPINGVMSAAVRDAIRDFQQRNRLPASGYVGPDTDAALRRVGGAGRGELEFEWEFELTGEAKNANAKLARAKDVELVKPLKPVPGLYRFYAPGGKFYTGMAAKSLRGRILQHLWCLSHLDVSDKGYRLAVYEMPGKNPKEIRALEKQINEYHIANNRGRTLNKRAELELQEWLEI
jgi:peptidoglycan hydrolase-like protein with peptidoglycan-binding domain